MILFTGNAVRADKLVFSWQSSFTPSSISPMQPTQGAQIYFLSSQGTSADSLLKKDYYALGTANQLPFLLPRSTLYDYTPFTMTLKLTDAASGLSKLLTFPGTVVGGILIDPPPGKPGERASFGFNNWKQAAIIGDNIYNVTIPPGTIEAWTDPMPNIFAQIDVTPVSNNPEPSSLLLSAMALPMLVLARRMKWAARTSIS
jgi:hypothetical protein